MCTDSGNVTLNKAAKHFKLRKNIYHARSCHTVYANAFFDFKNDCLSTCVNILYVNWMQKCRPTDSHSSGLLLNAACLDQLPTILAAHLNATLAFCGSARLTCYMNGGLRLKAKQKRAFHTADKSVQRKQPGQYGEHRRLSVCVLFM